MFEVRNRKDEVVGCSESFETAKNLAQHKHENRPAMQYDVYEVKQVWTTQTLDEAMDLTEKVAVDKSNDVY